VQNFLKIDPRVSELADREIWHFPLTLLVVLTTLSHYRVRCDVFIAIFLLSVTVKEFRKLVITWQSYGQEFGVLFLLDHGVYVNPRRLSHFA